MGLERDNGLLMCPSVRLTTASVSARELNPSNSYWVLLDTDSAENRL
jgi:hypothetical protein